MQIITPENKQKWLELRLNDITSTEVSALFGLSPYMTKFELWHHKKRGEIVELDENDRMRWGNKLEAVIAETIAEDYGWNIQPMKDYIRDCELRAGSSFDFKIIKDEPELLEIKNVDGLQFKDKWHKDEDGNYEAPLHIEMQVQHQLMVSGFKTAHIGALIGGNDLKLLKRHRDEIVIQEIKREIKLFWDSIDKNEPPEPDFEYDSEFIAKLYGYAEPNKVFDARGNDELHKLALEHKELGERMKTYDERRKELKARILMIIGDAEKIEGDDFKISAGIVSAAEYTVNRKPYRMFKPTWRKQ